MNASFVWRRWKLGFAVAILLSLLVSGAGLSQGMTWRQFVAVFSAACLTHVGAFLKDHPVDQIEVADKTATATPSNK